MFLSVGTDQMVLTSEWPACGTELKYSLLALTKPGKQSAPTLVSSRWHLIVTVSRFENYHLPLSESTPECIISSAMMDAQRI